MRSASVSLVRELGRLSVTSATMLPRLWPSWPTPKSAPATPTAVCVAIWREIASRECSRSACEISWPMTAASSSSVACSFSIRPVYMAILPPGMHHALTSLVDNTWTSQGHFCASGRNTAVWGMSRLVMAFTRCTWAASLSSAPFFCASAIIWAYCFWELASTSCSETSMCCFRSTPTAPCWVVSTVWQPDASAAEIARAAKKREPAQAAKRRQRKSEPRPAERPQPARGKGAERAARAVGHARKQRLAASLRGLREHALDCGHGGGVKGPEGRGVRELRDHDEPQHLGEPRQQEKANHGAREARRKDRGERKAPEELRQENEHGDLGNHAERPQHSDRGHAVAGALEMQCEEGVQRAVRRRHAKPAREQPQRRAVHAPRFGSGMRARSATRQR